MKYISMNRAGLIAAIIVVASGVLGATPFLLDHATVENAQQQFNTSVTIMGDSDNRSLGINADRNLEFGRIVEGSNATKSVNISIGKRSLLKLSTEGNISEVLEHRESMYVQGNQDIEIEAKGRDPGFYQGTVNLEFHIPRNKVGENWLDLKHRLSGLN